jgi:hypothetical protein
MYLSQNMFSVASLPENKVLSPLFLDLIIIFCMSYSSMNRIEKSIVEQSIALLNNSLSADDQVADKKLVRDAISRFEGLMERKD